jgi:gamma-glutamyltranspeptidase/glutathione hydrolase
MAFKNGKLLMPFGTPGGDVQAQAMVQTFLNIAEFGMDPQAAVDAPRFISWNFPNSFWPHDYLPGKLVFEDGIPTEVISELARRGHDNSPEGVRAVGNGDVCAVMLDHDLGILKGAADHRAESYVIGR